MVVMTVTMNFVSFFLCDLIYELIINHFM